MPHNIFSALGQLIRIIENDKLRTLSKSHRLNLAKNLNRGAKVTLKVTLLILGAMFFAAISRADRQTIITVDGKRFEKAHVTEVTPATATIVHATGVARVSLADLPADLQKKFGYDPAKAQVWLAEQAKAEQARRDREAAEKQKREEAERNREAVAAIGHYMDDGGHVWIDPHSGQLYDPDVEAARRAEAWKWIQRYGHRQSRPHSSPSAGPGRQ